MPRALWKWTRRIAIVLGIVIVALLVLAVVADRWIMPRLLERQIVASLSKHWDGRVTMQAVRFSFFGPTEIDSLRLEDNQGRPWVHIGRARANLRDWPGFSPVLDELDLDDVVVQVRVADDFPLIQPKEESDPSPYIDLQRIRAHRLALILHHNDELLDLGRLTLAVDIQDDNYRFNIAPLPGSDGRLRASGDIGGEPAQIRAQIRFDRQVGRDDMAFLQSFVRGNLPIRRAEGWLTAQADVRGAMAQWTQLDISATARMESWNFLIADDLPVTDLQADLQFQNWQLHASQVRLMVLGNPVTARGTVDMSADQVTYRGSARADKVDLQKLAAAFDLPR